MFFSSFGLWHQQKSLHVFLHSAKQVEGKFLLWGKKHAKREYWIRSFLKKPIVYLEDGFLRSPGLGVAGWPPLSMVADDLGIYYDTTRPSRLEALVLAADQMPSETLADAGRAAELIVAHGLSKYNHAPDFSWDLFQAGHPIEADTKRDTRGKLEYGENKYLRPSEKKVVLVIDQTYGDMAVKFGGADEQTFVQMFQTALAENPDAEIWVKTHPDVLSGKKRGYLTNLPQTENVRLLAADVNPISLLKQADKVYCVTSQMGFEALLLGKPVVVFGLPWYAGWGISDDRHIGVQALQEQNRRAPRTLMQLFAAAYLQYSRYIDPNTGEVGNIFDVIGYLAAARRLNEKLRGNLYCVGISLWKRAVIKPFFNTPSCRLHFVTSFKKLEKSALPPDTRLLVWGNGSKESADFAQKYNLSVLQMEDGFIRSVGLGSNLVPPLSLVCDDMGIYFSAEKPSRLEHILQNQLFTEQDFQTASWLQATLTEAEISKYNVGGGALTIPTGAGRVLLVPGQVEDDASIRYGSPEIHTNLDLLKKVRRQNPDAYIIYKPHPDVVSGNRVGAIAPEEAARYADQVVAECDITTCLKEADEVHTMTSLSGFEALLRGKTVHCYGLPFYAGWGLTQDYLNLPRRTRRLALWELVAGTLIHYADYIHPETKRHINAAAAIGVLRSQKAKLQHTELFSKHFIHKQWVKFKQICSLLK